MPHRYPPSHHDTRHNQLSFLFRQPSYCKLRSLLLSDQPSIHSLYSFPEIEAKRYDSVREYYGIRKLSEREPDPFKVAEDIDLD